jgi:hypothetical protein
MKPTRRQLLARALAVPVAACLTGKAADVPGQSLRRSAYGTREYAAASYIVTMYAGKIDMDPSAWCELLTPVVDAG